MTSTLSSLNLWFVWSLLLVYDTGWQNIFAECGKHDEVLVIWSRDIKGVNKIFTIFPFTLENNTIFPNSVPWHLLFSCVGVEDDRWRLVPVVARHFTRQITVRAGPARNIFVFTNWPTQHGLSRNKSQVFHWRLLLMLKYWFRTWCSDLSLKMWW